LLLLQVYIEACFREALRLHPAVGAVNRDVAADTTLKGALGATGAGVSGAGPALLLPASLCAASMYVAIH
jgi:hypothetical protein